MARVIPRPLLGDPPNAEAATQLQEAMSEISEKCWCASWLMGTEITLWKHLASMTPFHWGSYEVTTGDLQNLRQLSAACDGWIAWDPGTGERDPETSWPISGERWVPLTTWLQIYACATAKGGLPPE